MNVLVFFILTTNEHYMNPNKENKDEGRSFSFDFLRENTIQV